MFLAKSQRAAQTAEALPSLSQKSAVVLLQMQLERSYTQAYALIHVALPFSILCIAPQASAAVLIAVVAQLLPSRDYDLSAMLQPHGVA